MNMIVAVNSDWGIGFGNRQTVVIPEDREYFREVTDGGIIIVGRKTFESIGKPLTNRKNIVLTNNREFKSAGATVVHSMSEAFDKVPYNSGHKTFVIGGYEVYSQFLPWCSHVYVTKIGIIAKSDKYFPNLDKLQDWEVLCMGDVMESDGIPYSFELYRKVEI